MPTPDDLREEVNGYLKKVADTLFPFIDMELSNKAGDFVADGGVSIDISEIDNEEGEFFIYDEINNEMYDGGI